MNRFKAQMTKTVCFALLASLCLASPGLAQDQQRGNRGGRGFGGGPGGRGFGGFNKTSLLRSTQVQEELGVTGDQKASIDRVFEESQSQSRERFSGLRDLPEAERRAKLEELQAERRARSEKTESELKAILNDTQSKRLDEIFLQIRGIRAVTSDDVAGQLNINDEQKQKIRDLFQAQNEMQQELFSGLRDLPREERQQKMEELRGKSEELRAETEKAVKEILTSAQNEQFQQLQGKAFELDRQSFFQRGPGGGGRGRNGRNGNSGNSGN